MNKSDFRAEWSRLHGGAAVTGSIAGWLTISYAVARVLAFFRITPFLVTTAGIALSVAMLFTDYTVVIFLLLVAALICDGVDGSLAIYRSQASRFGELYDSLADRITEAIWIYMCSFLGISVRYLIIIWVLGALQEYIRAKLAALGYREIGVITPAERPMRAIFVAAALITYSFSYEVGNTIATIFIAVQIFSVGMIVKMARSLLTP